MKRLLIAIAAAATTMFASAAVLKQAAFEGTLDGGFAGGGGKATPYDNDGLDDADADYPFSGFGDYYCAIDADSDSPLTSSVSGTVFDMFVQFKAVDGAEVPSGAKIAIYLNSETNLVVVGDQAYDCGSPVAADSWARLTIAQVSGGYKVYVDGTPLDADGINDNIFPAETGATTVEFTGSGKLDNFVARTTDPFDQPSTYVASVGGETGERYATFADALADAAADSVIELNGNVDGTFALPAAGAKIKLNGYTFSGFSSVADDPLLVAVASTADGVTTYSSAYFPRTATAGQDGSAEHPYEIADVDDLKALQAYTEGYGRCYVQTANIALDAAWPGIGIQNGKDIVSKAEFDNGAFTGTYDGDNHTISGFQMVGQDGNPANVGKESSKWEGLDYCGFFNSTYGATIKNLKIAYAGSLFATDTTASTKESGATFVGVAKNSTLRNLTTMDGTVSCSKGFGGIVGYLMAGSTVDSCTNNVNLTSAASNKAGGIAMITQSGTGTATIRNCQNNGTTTGNENQKGGIVGYVGVATAIDGCSDTAGSTPSILHNQGQTVTISGVITAPTNGVAYTTSNNNPIDGLDFATVDANGIATFVKAADLAAGNTYKVMGPKAAYAFTQAGTLALDQSLAAATVTADTSTLVLSDETVDNVTTYTAVAGVASVNNVAYATFDEAVEAIGETGDDFVTLLANATTAATAGTTLKVKTNSHSLVFADGLVVTGTVDGDITTYTTTEGMAKCGNTWYATFADAYAAALSSSGNATMEVKLTSDFTPDISATYDHFYSLKFTDVRDDKTEGLTINLKNAAGTAYMKSSRYFFPENATLNLASDIGSQNLWTGGLVSGGTFNIPDGVTVEMGSYRALNNVAGVTGAGRIVPTTAACEYLLAAPNDVLPTSLRSNGWAGTLEVSGSYTTNPDFSKFGNAGSTVAFNGYTNYLHNVASVSSVGTVEIVGDGLVVNGGYASKTSTIASTLVGDGPLYVDVLDTAAGQSAKVLRFAGDASGFSGSISFSEDANAYVAFGSDTTNAKCIIVSAGKTAGIGAGSTWTAPGGIVVKGTLVVDGSVAGTIYSNTGAGVVSSSNSALTMSSFSGAWNGTYIVNWSPSDAFNPNSYATSYSKVALAKDLDAGAYFGSGSKEAFTITRPVRLDADVTIKNGWGSASKNYTVTFTELTGSKNLTLNGGSDSSVIRWYAITTLDGFGGQINIPNYSSLEIGTVNVSTMPEDGDRVVPMMVAANGTVGGNLALSVGGTDTGKTLTYMVGEEGEGLYYVVPVSYVAEIVGGEQYETLAEALADATDGATVKLLADVTLTDKLVVSNKTVTITADSAKTITGQLRVVDGSNVTIGENVTITSDKHPTVFVLGDPAVKTAGTAKSVLVVNGTILNTNAGFDQTFAIAGNGLDTKGVDITINGTVRNANGIAIYQAFPGNLVVNGTVEGASAISIKDGTLTVNDGAVVRATLASGAEYVGNNNGESPTGDAIIAPYYPLSKGYGTPVVSILGGTITVADTANCTGIEAYDFEGTTAPQDAATNVNVEGGLFNTPVAKVYCASGYIPCEVTGGYSVKVQTIDPTKPNSTQEVTVDTTLTVEEQKAAAIAAATVAIPAGVSGVDAETYKSYFTYSATPTATAGTYDVAITGFADVVTETADGNALAALEAATAGATLGTITVKPGLYYGTAAGADVTTLKAPAGTLNTTGTLDLSGVTKPSTGEAYFIKIKVGTTAFTAEE